jgi:glycosyltransferase involved in cell wall biosynthesis
LIERKGFSNLIAALERLQTVEFTLVVLGDGPLRQQLEAETQKCGFKIFFEGFRSTEELPLYYAACDIFVFPTLNDPWGLVVNEAMACGKPVVSSTEAGVSYDLVRHGANGWVVDPRNTEQLCNYLGKLIADNDLRRQMGETSSNIIQQFTPHALADAIVSASSLTGWQRERVSFAQGNS